MQIQNWPVNIPPTDSCLDASIETPASFRRAGANGSLALALASVSLVAGCSLNNDGQPAPSSIGSGLAVVHQNVFGSGLWQKGHQIIRAIGNDGFIVVGQQADGAPPNIIGPDIAVWRLSSTGALLWSKVYHPAGDTLADSGPTAIAAAMDQSGYFISGARTSSTEFDNAILIKIDPDGNILHQYVYSTPGTLWGSNYLIEGFTGLVPMRDGGCMVAGHVLQGNNGDLLVGRFDSALNPIFMQRVQTLPNETVVGASRDKPDAMLIATRANRGDALPITRLLWVSKDGAVEERYAGSLGLPGASGAQSFAYHESTAPRRAQAGAIVVNSPHVPSSGGQAIANLATVRAQFISNSGEQVFDTNLPLIDGHLNVLGTSEFHFSPGTGGIIVGFTNHSLGANSARDGVIYRLSTEGNLVGEPFVLTGNDDSMLFGSCFIIDGPNDPVRFAVVGYTNTHPTLSQSKVKVMILSGP